MKRYFCPKCLIEDLSKNVFMRCIKCGKIYHYSDLLNYNEYLLEKRKKFLNYNRRN